jgi:N-acetylmuramoyl-L-alanine amidase
LGGGLTSISYKRLHAFFLFPGRDALRDRRKILRGVYEENLALLNCDRLPTARRKAVRWNGIFLYPVFSFFAVVIHGHYRGSQTLQELPAAIKQDSSNRPATQFATEIPASSLKIAAAATEKPPEIPTAAPTIANPEIRAPSMPAPTPDAIANRAELSALEKSGNVPISRMLGLGISRIVIDAGHGGSDTGTIGRMGTLEKGITLDIALRLRARLAKSGFTRIHMTREDDSTVGLQERVISAQAANADLFVSIHVNYLPGTSINAVETYYFGPSRDQAVLKLAAHENTGSEYGLGDFEQILEKLGKKMKLEESKKLAESIQSTLFLYSSRENEKIKNKGVKRAPFAVLLGLDVPSVLAEVSCMSNTEEERELNIEDHRENIAGNLAAGLIGYAKGVNKNDIR